MLSHMPVDTFRLAKMRLNHGSECIDFYRFEMFFLFVI